MKGIFAAMDVPRETSEKLAIYQTLLNQWNPRINLVAKSTLEDAAERHFADSLQLMDMVQPGAHWADLGSGGGFPGLVIAIARPMETKVSLVESDQRKATFLRTVLRETGTTANVITKRIEEADPLGADILSARALASLDRLLAFAERHLQAGGTCLFHKGETWREEVEAARAQWRFQSEAIESKTNPRAVVLKIGGIERV
ncbi:16S rRNA (guanine(527)-N(7))-methyltransferase RsmG [Pseudooceanicola pacificus]